MSQQQQQQKFAVGTRRPCPATCLIGYIGECFTPAQIIKAFGPGLGPSDKANFEWIFIRTDGVPFTVYDYKSFICLESQYDFHVGSHQSDVEEFVAWFIAKVKEAM